MLGRRRPTGGCVMSAPIDPQSFGQHVEDALGHVFDHFYLQFHPLSGLLAKDAPPALRGRVLSRVLIDAIERLRPRSDTPATSLAWRKYQYIYLRYAEAITLDQISHQLGVSDRQGRRDHRQALDALTLLLWEQYRTSDKPAVEVAPAETAPDRSSDLEDELLRIGRVAPGAACHLAEVIDGALKTTARLIERNSCQVIAAIPENLPRIAINPLILREIIIGLITEAVELGRGSEVRLSATADGPRETLTVSVHASLPPADAALFVTSQRLAELQGAELSIQHDVSAALSRFVLALPVIEQATVLVIDDNPDVGLLFRRYLGQTYRLVQAGTAEEALGMAERTSPSLITLDVMMPGLDGWQILERLRQNPRTSQIPVIVCSILPEPSLATALGAAAYLPKPINPLVLRSMLHRQLAQPTPAHPDLS